MFTFRLIRWPTLIAALVCVAACGDSNPPLYQAPSSGARGNFSYRANGSTYQVKKGLLFVALAGIEKPYNDVQIYDVRKSDPAPLADITDNVDDPQSVCIDKRQTVYVLNGDGWVSEYALGSTNAKLVITNGIIQPGFCAIDSAGNLWVTNVGGANVTEYLPGASVPNKVITNGVTYPVGIAFDHRGNMYVANNYSANNANVVVFRSGGKTPSRTISNGVQWPVGINVDAGGTLFVTNLIPGNIAEYHYGSSKPFHEITQEMNGPAAVTFSPSGWMYVTNVGVEGGGSGPARTILEFPPHSQVPGKKMITKDLDEPIGTAFYPPMSP